jgi:glycerophosphoryl diester phosphodiesterase
MPSSPSRRAELAGLGAAPFAHRGLHGPAASENSLASFEAAAIAGHGIELDVRLSGDGEAIVFHDESLRRLTGDSGTVAARTVAELRRLRLPDGQPIATLGDALRLVAGRAPVLIEAKAPGRRVGRLCEAIRRDLEDSAGPAGVMSFNPEVGRWFARRAPGIFRGLVVSERGKTGLRGRIERRLALLRSSADFLACDIGDLPSAFAAAARADGRPVYTWTVRSEADRARAAAHADQIIYEPPPR